MIEDVSEFERVISYAMSEIARLLKSAEYRQVQTDRYRAQAKLWHGKYAIVCLENNKLRRKIKDNELNTFPARMKSSLQELYDTVLKKTFELQHPELAHTTMDTITFQGSRGVPGVDR